MPHISDDPARNIFVEAARRIPALAHLSPEVILEYETMIADLNYLYSARDGMGESPESQELPL